MRVHFYWTDQCTIYNGCQLFSGHCSTTIAIIYRTIKFAKKSADHQTGLIGFFRLQVQGFECDGGLDHTVNHTTTNDINQLISGEKCVWYFVVFGCFIWPPSFHFPSYFSVYISLYLVLHVANRKNPCQNEP